MRRIESIGVKAELCGFFTIKTKDMIIVTKFTISTSDRKIKQPFKDITIFPENGGQFEFFEARDLNFFMDELRQTFEIVFVTGCAISATYNNAASISA